jgi:hypothetical protein
MPCLDNNLISLQKTYYNNSIGLSSSSIRKHNNGFQITLWITKNGNLVGKELIFATDTGINLIQNIIAKVDNKYPEYFI